MTLSDLARQLRDDYDGNGVAKGIAASVHLFGIRWADELEGMSLRDLCVHAGIPVSYVVEISKGRNLAKYVEIKREFRANLGAAE